MLGDQAGAIKDSPNTGVFAFVIPFSVSAGTSQIAVSFDWAFSGADTSSIPLVTDVFSAGIGNVAYATARPGLFTTTLLTQSNPFGTAGYSGNFNQTVSVTTPGNYYLAFILAESILASPGSTNSAVGIDNINVAAVPVPAAVWLFSVALAGFGLAGCGSRDQREPR